MSIHLDPLMAIPGHVWAHMSHHAQTRWLKRRAAALAARQSAPVDTAAPATPQAVDARGRCVWTPDQMRAANRAREQWRDGRGPEPTAEQMDAACAYKRWRAAEKREGRSGKRARPAAETIAYIEAVTANPQPISLGQAARDLGILPASLLTLLTREHRQDLVAKLRASK